MLAATIGLESLTSTSLSTIPQMAPAARVKMVRETGFSPETSTILGIMTMSLVPT